MMANLKSEICDLRFLAERGLDPLPSTRRGSPFETLLQRE